MFPIQFIKKSCNETTSRNMDLNQKSVLKKSINKQEMDTSSGLDCFKIVDFSKTVRVCLIPRREEFESIKHNIWWETQDYEAFKVDSFYELFAIMNTYGCTRKEGMSLLYEPNQSNASSEDNHNNCGF